MSVIFPAGAKRHDWMNKSASGEKIGVEAMSDEELGALVPGVEIEEVEVVAPGGMGVSDEMDIDEEGEMDDIPGTPEDEGEIEEAGSVEEKAAQLAESAEDLVDQALEVAEEAQEVAEMATGGEVAEEEIIDEVEDELEGDMGEEISIEEEALESITPGEPEEMEKETCQHCGGAKGVGAQASTEKAIVVAGEDVRMVRMAALSPENKKKVRDYWVNGLGYPAKYVDQMVTDYEK